MTAFAKLPIAQEIVLLNVAQLAFMWLTKVHALKMEICFCFLFLAQTFLLVDH